jgi:hypothetical protein
LAERGDASMENLHLRHYGAHRYRGLQFGLRRAGGAGRQEQSQSAKQRE